MRNAIIFCFAVLLISCNEKVEKSVSYYYDVDSLMVKQKQVLGEKKAAIVKWARVDSATAEATVTPDSLQAWNSNFQIFEKININKPALKGVYEVKEYDDSRSNLKIREYSSTKEGVEVPFLKLYYLQSVENLKMIEARYIEDNPIFKSQRNLKFVFDDFTGQPLLKTFSIKGSQKMLLKDRVEFEVKGEIVF